jgi:hypothetical protein
MEIEQFCEMDHFRTGFFSRIAKMDLRKYDEASEASQAFLVVSGGR